MRLLIAAAWVAFLADAAGIGLLAWTGLSEDPLGRAIALGIAELAAAPLALLLAGLALSTWFRSRVGLWICLALGLAPIILVLGNLALHGA